MDDDFSYRVLRIILQGGFMWYDVRVGEDFDLSMFILKCKSIDYVYLKNEDIELFLPMNELKSMSVLKAKKEVSFNVINFPGAPPCELPKKD
jgi:hypothetical protein